MQRAAAGLARRCALLLAERGRGVRRPRAAARRRGQQRRRRAVRRGAAGPPGRRGQRAAARRRSGCTPAGWPRCAPPAAGWSTAAPAGLDLVVDGIVGHRRPRAGCAAGGGRGRERPASGSGRGPPARGRGRRAQRRRRGHRGRARRGGPGRRDRHLRLPQAGARGRAGRAATPGRWSWSTSGWPVAAGRPGGAGARARRRRGWWPRPGRRLGQVHPRRGRRRHRLGRPTRARPCCRSAGRWPARPGWSATRAAPPTQVLAAPPVGDRRAPGGATPAGCRPGCAAAGWAPTSGRRPSCGPCWPRRCRSCSTPTRSPCWSTVRWPACCAAGTRRSWSPRTTASSPGWPARRPAATGSRAALRLAAWLNAVVLLKGDRTIVATPDGQAWVNPTGTPALATGGTGDVLAGLLGSLLAAGLPTPAGRRRGRVRARARRRRRRPWRPGDRDRRGGRPPAGHPHADVRHSPLILQFGRPLIRCVRRVPLHNCKIGEGADGVRLGRMWQAEVRVDLDAIRDQRGRLRAGTTAEVMAVVKARRVRARHAAVGARRARRRGHLARRLHPRRGARTAPRPASPRRVLAWLLAPGLPLHEGVAADVDLSAASTGLLAEIVAAAGRAGRPARVHLKIDTGLARGGATAADWPALAEAAAKAQADGHIEVVGVWSHFVYADAPGHPTIDRQLGRLRRRPGGRRAARRHPALPAHRQLGRHADPAGRPLRPGPPGHRGLRAVSVARSAPVSPAVRRSGCGRR